MYFLIFCIYLQLTLHWKVKNCFSFFVRNITTSDSDLVLILKSFIFSIFHLNFQIIRLFKMIKLNLYFCTWLCSFMTFWQIVLTFLHKKRKEKKIHSRSIEQCKNTGKKQQILSTAVLLPFEMRCSVGLPQTQKEGRHLGLGTPGVFSITC